MISYATSHYAVYLLVLLRMVGFIGTSPILSVRLWPMWSKVGLAAFVALVVTPDVHATVPDPLVQPDVYIGLALKETLVGMLMGFVATVMTVALSTAGQLFDLQIGFSTATLFDPSGGQSAGLTNAFLSALFTLYFLGMNGLDGLVLGVMKSYDYVALGAFVAPHEAWTFLAHLITLVMVLGLQVGAPLLAALLLTDITFAFLSRAVPQMNVYVVGQPAKLFVGLAVFAAVMPGIVYMLGVLFQATFSELDTLLRWMGG
ncbi:flagellar biosynthetic protein FliR [Alicyclobacillus contaminans]|uniref:flagellar biosynthetic protein FliR n=1 Tax=Alicyclobacillus contaminans TaxID=392016 RepID=UPI00047D8767|nr:flagellar biosynthetic protein FliR [Alicyclobacillus contaminans]